MWLENYMANNARIKSDTKLMQFCTDILDEYLSESSKFVKDINSSTERSYQLSPASGNWYLRQNAHGKAVPVVLLRNEFFMSCSISFKPNGQRMDFKSISLQFYDVKKLLFRAEWDNWEIKKEESSEDEDIKQHPQPHWHLGESNEIGVTEKVAATFQEHIHQFSYPQFEQKMREREKRDLSRLHFFMGMEKDTPQPVYFDLTYEEYFKEWLRETMRSVDQELSYLSK